MTQTLKLLLLDKDGTITETASGKTFVNEPTDQKLLDGAATAIARYLEAGWNIVVVSNQGGVGYGHKTLQSAMDEMLYCNEMISEALGGKQAFVDCYYFCPDKEGRVCWVCQPATANAWAKLERQTIAGIILEGFRKPHPGMLSLAKRMYGSADDLECLMVGDRPEDLEASNAAGIPYLDAALWRSGEMFTPGEQQNAN